MEAEGDDAREIAAEIVRTPRIVAVTSAMAAVAAATVVIAADDVPAGALLALVVPILLLLVSLHQIRAFSPAAIARLQHGAEQGGGPLRRVAPRCGGP